MSSKASQRLLLNEFMQRTGAGEKVATKFLKSSAWRKDLALESYYKTGILSKEKDLLNKLFDNYHDHKDEEDFLGVDGVMRYLQDLGVDLATAEIFVPLAIVKAPGLGEVSRTGFVEGWMEVRCDQLGKQKLFVANQIKQLSVDMSLFKNVYRHAFIASKESSQKSLPLDNAILYWTLLFSPPGKRWVSQSIDWLNLWINFLQENWKKTVNRDMWNQTFEFFTKTLEDEKLGFWSEDGAWPGVIDSFVAHVRPIIAKSSGSTK